MDAPEDLQLKARLAAAPRRLLPADLAAAILAAVEPQAGLPWWRAFLAEPSVWLPAGALAAAAAWLLLFGPGLEADAEPLPLEPLMASHARYVAENLVPAGDLLAAEYSSRLESRHGGVR